MTNIKLGITLLVLIVATISNLNATDNKYIAQKSVKKNITEDILNTFDKQKKFVSNTLNQVVELEQPNDYQKKEIYGMFNELCKKAEKSQIKQRKKLISYINSLIPDTSNEYETDTTLFKHAFPLKKGTKPLGFFDCDARSILVLSVLEALNKSKDIYIVDMMGHAVLVNVNKNKYLDLTLQDIEVIPDESQLITSNVLFSYDDLKSLILSNMATDVLVNDSAARYSAESNVRKQAIELFRQAVELNPRNVTALNNLKASLRDSSKKGIYNMQILAVFTANYTNNNKAKSPNLFLIPETKISSSEIRKDAANFVKAFHETNIIKNFTFGEVMFPLFNANMYQEFLRIGEELLKDKKIDEIKDIQVLYYKLAVASLFTERYSQYEKYKKRFYDLEKDKSELYYKNMKNLDRALAITTGEITPEEFVKRKDNFQRLYFYIQDGYFYDEITDAVEFLKKWVGLSEFREQVNMLSPKEEETEDEEE